MKNLVKIKLLFILFFLFKTIIALGQTTCEFRFKLKLVDEEKREIKRLSKRKLNSKVVKYVLNRKVKSNDIQEYFHDKEYHYFEVSRISYCDFTVNIRKRGKCLTLLIKSDLLSFVPEYYDFWEMILRDTTININVRKPRVDTISQTYNFTKIDSITFCRINRNEYYPGLEHGTTFYTLTENKLRQRHLKGTPNYDIKLGFTGEMSDKYFELFQGMLGAFPLNTEIEYHYPSDCFSKTGFVITIFGKMIETNKNKETRLLGISFCDNHKLPKELKDYYTKFVQLHENMYKQ